MFLRSSNCYRQVNMVFHALPWDCYLQTDMKFSLICTCKNYWYPTNPGRNIANKLK